MRGEGIYATNVRAILHHGFDGTLRDEVPCYSEKNPGNTCYCDLYCDELDVAIEIKSCKRDLRSGYGLNWIGKYNWLVCPPDCAIEASKVLDERGEDFVGIMAFEAEDEWCVENPLEISDAENEAISGHWVILRNAKEMR